MFLKYFIFCINSLRYLLVSFSITKKKKFYCLLVEITLWYFWNWPFVQPDTLISNHKPNTINMGSCSIPTTTQRKMPLIICFHLKILCSNLIWRKMIYLSYENHAFFTLVWYHSTCIFLIINLHILLFQKHSKIIMCSIFLWILN
jgi:hypothetical protein